MYIYLNNQKVKENFAPTNQNTVRTYYPTTIHTHQPIEMAGMADEDQRICTSHFFQNEELFFEDVNESRSLDSGFLKAAFLTKKLWPKNTVITVSFLQNPSQVRRTPLSVLQMSGSIDPLELEIVKLSPVNGIKKVIEERIIHLVGLQIRFVESNGNIRISFQPSGAYSYVGTDALRISNMNTATMNFGWLDVRTIIHEFGHALGLINEHQNPRGNTIDWDVNKVYEWASRTQGWDRATTYHNIIKPYETNVTNGSQYDPNSIMLYFFPGSLTKSGKGTSQNNRLSCVDMETLSETYPKNPPIDLNRLPYYNFCKNREEEETTGGEKCPECKEPTRSEIINQCKTLLNTLV